MIMKTPIKLSLIAVALMISACQQVTVPKPQPGEIVIVTNNNGEIEYDVRPADGIGGIPTDTSAITQPPINPSTPVVTSPQQPPVTGGTVSTPIGTTPGLHTVQQGEGLYGIARQYGLNFRDVAAWNNIPPPYILKPGQQLTLSPSGNVSNYVPPVTTVTPAPVSSNSIYIVQKGDTLYSVSRRYGLAVDQLAAINGISINTPLSIGQQLRVSSTSSGLSATSTGGGSAFFGSDLRYHIVRPGESLASIAMLYNRSVPAVASVNNIAPPYRIYENQRLLIP